MARRHWRFVVRDQRGFVIQNARVFVYQPGTTNNFTGTAYNAASGGATVTNPFTTNAFGEVEAWFDNAQVVDVQVDDNSNTAYRAVGGVSDTVDFTTFTEKDDIYVSASDQVIENPHGVSSHTDVTRSLWLPINDGVVADSGTLAVRGTLPDALRVITLADAATSGANWTYEVPDDWASGAMSMEVYHAGQTTGGGVVRWQYGNTYRSEGDSVVSTVAGTAFTGQAPTTADLLVIEAAQSIGTPTAAGQLGRLWLRRLGADGADTYAASTSLIGVRLTYTANQ